MPVRLVPFVGSVVMSERLRSSSTKYGPSVSAGVTMHVGVATEPAVGVAFEEAEGVGEPSEAEDPRPVQAATIAPKPKMSAVRREMSVSKSDFTTRQSRAND